MSGKVTMLESGVRGFANAVKRFAVKDKKFAEELVYMHGIRSEITPNALKGITKDMFDKAGKLTEKGKKEVTGLMRELNLPKTATWDDALAAMKVSKEKVAMNINSLKMKLNEIPNAIVKKIAPGNYDLKLSQLDLTKWFEKNFKK